MPVKSTLCFKHKHGKLKPLDAFICVNKIAYAGIINYW